MHVQLSSETTCLLISTTVKKQILVYFICGILGIFILWCFFEKSVLIFDLKL